MKGWQVPAPMSSKTPVVAAQDDNILPASVLPPRPRERVLVTLAKSATFRRRNLHLVRRPRFVTSWLTRAPQCATSNAPLCRFGSFCTSLLDARRADGETEPKASRARREPV